MRNIRKLNLAILALGSTMILGGCSPTIQSTVENGVITISQSLLTASLSAIIELFTEATNASAMILSSVTPFVS